MEDHKPTVRARHLGAALTAAMEAKGMIAMQMANKLHWSPSRVSRLLSGKRTVKPIDVSAFLALCDVTGPQRDALLDLAENSYATQWCQEHGMTAPASVPTLENLEDSASSVTCLDVLAVPALLQTEDYTRAALRANPTIRESEIDDRVIHCAKRTQLLSSEANDRREFRFFVNEHVLTNAWLDRATLSDQAHHIIRLAVRPHVEIRLVPADVGITTTCLPFQLMTFDEFSPVVHVKNLNVVSFFENKTTVSGFRRILSRLNEVAYSETQSRSRLAELGASLGEPQEEVA